MTTAPTSVAFATLQAAVSGAFVVPVAPPGVTGLEQLTVLASGLDGNDGPTPLVDGNDGRSPVYDAHIGA